MTNDPRKLIQIILPFGRLLEIADQSSPMIQELFLYTWPAIVSVTNAFGWHAVPIEGTALFQGFATI